MVLCKISLLRESESLKKSSGNSTRETNNSYTLRPSHTFSLSLSLPEQCHGFCWALGCIIHTWNRMENLQINCALNQITVQRRKREGKTQRVTASFTRGSKSLRRRREWDNAILSESSGSFADKMRFAYSTELRKFALGESEAVALDGMLPLLWQDSHEEHFQFYVLTTNI